MRFLYGFATAIAVMALALLVLARGGYNVAATERHSPMMASLLHGAMRESVRQRAAGIEVPAPVDEERLSEGFIHFNAMCIECHGGPGIEPGESGQGLEPRPPSLARAAQRWSAAELFWIVKHGVRMTGMPAFGPTHSDEQLWDIVAVLQQLPHLDAQSYRARVAPSRGSHHDSLDAPAEGAGGSHHH